MNNNSLENRVWEKLERKIAIEKFDDEEKIQKREKIKMRKKSLVKVASFSIIALFLTGNIYTYATENKNIFTWAFEKIGIFQNYEESIISVNESKVSNDYTLTFEDYGLDKENLLITFDLKSNKEDLNFDLFLESDIGRYIYERIDIMDGDNLYNLSNENITRMIDKINSKEYKLYYICKIDLNKITENSILQISATFEEAFEGQQGYDYKTLGKWDFEIPVSKEKISEEYEEYDIINGDICYCSIDDRIATNENEYYSKDGKEYFPTASMLQLKNSKIATKITILLKEYGTEPGLRYTIEVLDNNGNVILPKDMQFLIGGVASDIIMKNVDMNSVLTVYLYEEYLYEDGYKDEGIGIATLDLNKDVKISENQKETEKISKDFLDVTFLYQNNAEIYETIRGYSFDDSETNYLSFKFNNKIPSSDYYITITAIDNIVNIQDLDELVEVNRRLIYLGNYGIHSEVPLYKENGEEIIFSFKQLMDIFENKKIIVDGNEYSINDFNIQEVEYRNIKRISLDNGNLEGITFIEEYPGSSSLKHYMFILNNKIYDINFENNITNIDMAEEFVNNMRVIR